VTELRLACGFRLLGGEACTRDELMISPYSAPGRPADMVRSEASNRLEGHESARCHR